MELREQFEKEHKDTIFDASFGSDEKAYIQWLENRLQASPNETLVMCTNCGNEDIKDERIDLEVHDGNFWRIEVKWCPDCKELLSLNEY